MSDKKPAPKRPNDANNRAPAGANGGNWFSRGWFWIVLVILLVIGPKVEEVEQAAVEDATVFMPMAALPKTSKVAAASVPSPRASVTPSQAPAPAQRQGKWLYGVLAVVVVAAGLWALTLL